MTNGNDQSIRSHSMSPLKGDNSDRRRVISQVQRICDEEYEREVRDLRAERARRSASRSSVCRYAGERE